MKRTASAIWNGSLKEGNGKISTQSNVLSNHPYSFKTRFEDEKGTNPDELIAAAHAGCFAMALSMILGKEGYTPESLEAKATITMDTENLELTASHLVLNAQVPDISNEKFLECANMAKENCPVSKVLNLKITLEATLNK